MARQAAPHHRGSYRRQSAIVRAAANANEATRCWRCHKTIAEVRETKPHAVWQAGHLNDGQINGPLLPECSPCNTSNGATMGNRKRQPQPNPSRSW